MKQLRRKIQALFQGKAPALPAAGLDGATSFGLKELESLVRAHLKQGQTAEALKLAQQGVAQAGSTPGFHTLLAYVLDRIGRHEEALQALEIELTHNPAHADARARRDRLAKALARPVPDRTTTAQRSWKTSLPRQTLLGIQQSLHNYHYRGVPMLKNPFDVALYPMLVWQLKPRTIFEIGSKSGGSALWFGDLVESFGIDCRIYSLDLVRVESVSHPRVTFLEGDGRALHKSLTPEFLAGLPRPWLVIEDADHAYETSSAALRFFHPLIQAGEYIVVEDGIISDLTDDEDCNSGPHRALKEFLQQHPQEYEIDGDYCDFFGLNLTWCTNGFLKRIAAPASTSVGAATAVEEARRLADAGQSEAAFHRLNEIKAQRMPARDVDYLRALHFLRAKQPAAAREALKEELRYFPDNSAATAELEKLAYKQAVEKPAGREPEFEEILKVIRPYTMVGEARLHSLYQLARQVCVDNLAGNFVECGVAAGGSSALLAAVIARHSRQPRELFSFDTFSGMPAASTRDKHKGVLAEESGWGAGTCAAPEASLREVCRALGVEHLVQPVPGFFADTLPAQRGNVGAIALLHMDGDWYSSTRDILTNIFDQVVPGGRIQIDDYGYWEGCQQAVSEFERERGLQLNLHRIDETGVWLTR